MMIVLAAIVIIVLWPVLCLAASFGRFFLLAVIVMGLVGMLLQ